MQNVHSIIDYGAVSGGESLCTQAIQAAIDACHQAGGGRVLCPQGVFLTGSLTLKSNVELYLAQGCRLLASTDIGDYLDFDAPGFRGQFAAEKTTKALLRAIDAHHVAIAGPGTIDGAGLAFYDTDNVADGPRPFFRKPDNERPRMVMMLRCTDVRIEQAAFVESPCWTFWLMQCRRVGIHRIRIHADQRMINNDGIDIDSCRDVTIGDCIMKTGDDCIVLRAVDAVFDQPMACENVTVANCVLDSWCQGVRIGCPSDGTIRNATFANLTIASRNNGILFENPTRYLRQGTNGSADIHDILFSNLSIQSQTGSGIRLNVEEGIALRRLSDIAFANFQVRSGNPCMIVGSPETTIRDIRFSNGTIHAGGREALELKHCERVELQDVRLSNAPTRKESSP